MSPTTELTNFAQSVYRRYKGRRFDDISGEDGQTFIMDVVDFANGFLDELETMVDPSGKPLDWKWSWQTGYTLGTASTGISSITLPTAVLNLIVADYRYVQILQDGTPVSNWAVVDISQINSNSDRITEDMVAQVGRSLIFSRPLKDTEASGTIIGDVTLPVPRIAYTTDDAGNVKATNVKALSMITPRELLVLGTVKNESLPDIIQGKLNPALTQRFTALLNNAIARNMVSSMADEAETDDMSGTGGIY